jgi:hypothetical protein
MRIIEVQHRGTMLTFVMGEFTNHGELSEIIWNLRGLPGVRNPRFMDHDDSVTVSMELEHSVPGSSEFHQLLKDCTRTVMCTIGALTYFTPQPNLPVSVFRWINQWTDDRIAACNVRRENPDEVRDAYVHECGESCLIT